MIMMIGEAGVAIIQFINLLVRTSQVGEYFEILPVFPAASAMFIGL